MSRSARLAFPAALMACLLTTSAIAGTGQAKPSFTGVWTGHIGKLAITACFNDSPQDVAYGNYYYQHRLVPINLYGYPDTAGKVDAWHESDGKWHADDLLDYEGTWKVTSLLANKLQGIWSNRSGSRKLPIDLTRIEYAPQSAEQEKSDNTAPVKPCSSEVYQAAIEGTFDTFFGPVRATNNVKYRYVAKGFPGMKKREDYTDRELYIATIELIGESPSIQSINDDLRERLSPEHEADLRECRRKNFDVTAPREENYVETITSVSVAANRLVINTKRDGSCGERGIIGDDTHMWNLETGKRESLLTLFSNNESTGVRSEGSLPDALDTLIANRLRRRNDPTNLSWKEIQECYGKYELGAYSYELKVTTKGIRFEIPPVPGGACGESITLTFKELRPFLNKDGRRFVTDLAQTLRNP